MNAWPYMAKNVRVMAMLAAVKRRSLKNRTSSIGLEHLSSHTTKAPMTTRPRPRGTITPGVPQPLDGASMIAHSTDTNPTIDRAAPIGSRRGASASFDDGSRYHAPTRATAMTGTFTKKTEPHEKCFSRKPPSTGPRALLAPATAAHAPMARPRSRVTEEVGEQRQRGRHDQRGPDAHRRPGEDQLGRVLGQARHDRAEAEDHHAHHEGMVIFGLGSIMSGLAKNPTELIFTRASMGIGARCTMPATLSLLTNLFRDPRMSRSRAMRGVGVAGASSALGPVLGGFLLKHFSWGCVFFVNVPVIAVAVGA